MPIISRSSKSKKVILITGATGFIGRQTVRPLIERGYQVHVLTSNKQNLSSEFVETFFNLSAQQTDSVTMHFCNLLDFSNLDHRLEEILSKVKPSHLLHMAWFVKHGQFWSSNLNLDWVSLTMRLVTHFEKFGGVRVVMSGSCAEYDWSQLKTSIVSTTENVELCSFGLIEEAPVGSNTLYGECKLGVFKIIQKFLQNNQLELAWGRIFLTYGPYEGANRLIPYLIQTLLRGQLSQLKVNIHQIRDFLHVKDLALSFVHLVDHDVVGVFNTASGQPVKIERVLRQIAQQLNIDSIDMEKWIENYYRSPQDADYLFADVNKITSTGWSPQISLEQGLAESVLFWKEQV